MKMIATVIMKMTIMTIIPRDRMMSKNGQCRDCRNWVGLSRLLQDRVLGSALLCRIVCSVHRTAVHRVPSCRVVSCTLQQPVQYRILFYLNALQTNVHCV